MKNRDSDDQDTEYPYYHIIIENVPHLLQQLIFFHSGKLAHKYVHFLESLQIELTVIL